MLRKLHIILLLLSIHLITHAEEWSQPYENILTLRYGGLWQQDQYLSPLLYSGQAIGISNEWWQNFRRDTTQHWQHVGQLHITGAMAYSERKNNLIYSMGLQGGWGTQYTWKWPHLGLQLLLGPYIDMDLSPKIQASNVNKPYSMDLSINLNAMGGIRWTFNARKTSYRLQYLARANIIGIDYLPDYWHSYFEMSEGVLGQIRCAGMWNHRRLHHELTFDMQFIRSTWRIGVKHEYIEYGTPNMMFSREQVSAIIGWIWEEKRMRGRIGREF